VCSLGALAAASRLNRGYLTTLATSLLDLSRRDGAADQTVAHRTLTAVHPSRLRQAAAAPVSHAPIARASIDTAPLDPAIRDILGLRSRNRQRVVAILSREDGLTPGLVPHAITLLAWDQVADHALFAPRKVAEEHVGQRVDALLAPNQEFAIRRRLPPAFSVCAS